MIVFHSENIRKSIRIELPPYCNCSLEPDPIWENGPSFEIESEEAPEIAFNSNSTCEFNQSQCLSQKFQTNQSRAEPNKTRINQTRRQKWNDMKRTISQLTQRLNQ